MRPIRILVIDDDPEEFVLIKGALDAANVFNEVHFHPHGGEAVLHLKEDVEEGKAAPDIILLDMLMPEVRGREVLAHLKSDPRLRKIDVIALTNFVSEGFVQKVYDEGVCSYIRKPFTVESFLLALQKMPGRRYGIAIVAKDRPAETLPGPK